MTNLEFYKDEIYDRYRDLWRRLSTTDSIGKAFCDIYEKHNPKHADICCLLIWLLEEHKEPIKLTKFEYDLLMSYINKGYFFKNYSELKEMRNKGYFKGVADTSMKIIEILNNCEVIE